MLLYIRVGLAAEPSREESAVGLGLDGAGQMDCGWGGVYEKGFQIPG